MSEKVAKAPRQFVEKLPEAAVAVPNFLGIFATPAGEIFSTAFHSRPVKLRHRLSSDGYFQVGLIDLAGKRRSVLVHRILAELFVAGDIKLTVDHRDGVRTNNALTNLRWLPRADNAREGMARHPERIERIRKALSFPVRSVHVTTGAVEEFPSVVAAAASVRGAKTKYLYRSEPNGSNISRAIREGKPAYRRLWSYA